MALNTIISQIADFTGCSFYRMRTPLWMYQAQHPHVISIETPTPVGYAQFYENVRLIRLQRPFTPEMFSFFKEFLMPCAKHYGFWINFESDDAIGIDGLPKYNSAYQVYQSQEYNEYINYMMNNSDFITVTTEELGHHYIKKYNVDITKFLVVPNYLPKWWFDGFYDLDKIKARYNSLKNRKPRIGFPVSASHYDQENKNGGIDDFTHIVDLVKETIDEYQWVFVCGIPAQLNTDEYRNKLEVYPGWDIYIYPKMINSLNLDLMICPLQDNVFNRCKSNIKFSESAALGVPAIFQDLTPYQPYSNILFKDKNDLQNRIDEILTSKKKYLDIVKSNKDILDNGNEISPNGWWLDNNIFKWKDIFEIQQKTVHVDLSEVIKSKSQVSFNNLQVMGDTVKGDWENE